MTLFQILFVLSSILALTFLFILSVYNILIKLRNRVKTDFSDIDVQLHRRATLVEQLVELVKGYASHEKETFSKVTQARAALDNSETAHDAAKADNMLQGTLRSLFMVSEAYPDLKADKNYQSIKNDLVEAENAVARYRQEYNQSVETFNNTIQTFPNLLVANMFGFDEAQLFQSSVTEAFVTSKQSPTKSAKSGYVAAHKKSKNKK